jgi:phosphatidate cytidylyltransferase
MLWQRVLTAMVGVPLVVILIGYGKLPVVRYVMALMAGWCAYEASLLLWKPMVSRFGIDTNARRILARAQPRMPWIWGGVAAVVFYLVSLSGGLGLDVFVVLMMGVLAVAGFGGRTPEASVGSAVAAMTIMMYTVVPWIAMWGLYLMGPHARYLLLTLVVVWSGDTFAYFTGRAIGRHKMSKVLSPSKTWEGAVGGFIASIAGALALNAWYGGVLAETVAVVVAAGLGGVAGQFGDLFESMLKRFAGVKDSGKSLPGHGGILDRIDGVMFAAPVIWAVLLLAERL